MDQESPSAIVQLRMQIADIGLLADEKLPANLYHKIRNTIDESIIPWEVDIMDFTRADQTFKDETLKDIEHAGGYEKN